MRRHDPVTRWIQETKRLLGITQRASFVSREELLRALVTASVPKTPSEKVVDNLGGTLFVAWHHAVDVLEDNVDLMAYAFFNIMRVLADGQHHSWKELFAESGVPNTAFDQRLSDLVRNGLVKKKILPAFPPRTEYTATFTKEKTRYFQRLFEGIAVKESLILSVASQALLMVWSKNVEEARSLIEQLLDLRTHLLDALSEDMLGILDALNLWQEKKPTSPIQKMRMMLRSFNMIQALYFTAFCQVILELPELRDISSRILKERMQAFAENQQVKQAVEALSKLKENLTTTEALAVSKG